MSIFRIGVCEYAIGIGIDEWDAYRFQYDLSIFSSSLSSGKTSSRSFIFLLDSKITSTTKYTIVVTKYNSSGESIGSQDITITGKPGKSGWDWTESTSLAAIPTKLNSSLTALNKKTGVFNFSHEVWNDLVAKAYNMVKLRGASWNTQYCSLADTFMNADDRTLTAARFNTWRFNVGRLISTGVDEKSRGDPVLAGDFFAIINSINIGSS